MAGTSSNVHITVLDGLVSMNSIFSLGVFVGMALAVQGQHSLQNSPACDAPLVVVEKLVLYEVISFGFFLFSSLSAQGLKLAVYLLNSKDADSEVLRAHISPKVIRLGMMVSTIGSVLGCVFLMLSMVCLIEIKLGTLSCGSKATLHAVTALICLVASALIVYIATVMYAVYAIGTDKKI